MRSHSHARALPLAALLPAALLPAALLLVPALAVSAGAQDTTLTPGISVPATATGTGGRSFTLMPHVGFLRFSVYSGLEHAPALALDARYDVSSRLAVGTAISVARANTRGGDFITALRYGDPSKGDTTFIFRLQQPVTLLDAQLNATFTMPAFARVEPYVTGGAGIYSFFLDPQANAGTARDFSRLSALLGGGLRLRLSPAAGITLDVRDLVLTNFDRNRLAPSDARFRSNVYPEDFAPPPAARDLVHNVMFSVGFTWTPARLGGEGAP